MKSFLILFLLETAFAAVPAGHPRLLGSRTFLQQLAAERASAYQRMESVARTQSADDHSKMTSLALVAAVENDSALARQAVALAMPYITGPIQIGHTTFGHDLANCALVYDLCYEYWTPTERSQFHSYMNATVDSNVNSETQVFHNSWYGYKNWGIGMACYAAYYENPRAPAILDTLFSDYYARAVPALEMAGEGGGWAEGYYVHYWSYEWLFFCEVARLCGGVDLYSAALKFYQHRAVASMFEMYPGLSDYGSRRPVPMGDGGGRVFGGDRDKALSARRILVNYFRNDPACRAVHTFNETTPRVSVGVYAYKDFLWRDTTVQKGDLNGFKLSHISRGPGTVFARSGWDENAVYFYFKCGDRFTAHQHLDVGHFNIYKNAELCGDGGHYDAFGSVHDVNYHLRTIAHSTMRVLNPSEAWPGATAYTAGVRAGTVTGNDGGQHHSFPNHNGAVADVAAWMADSAVYDIADILAFEDKGGYLYVAGDCGRAYASSKMDYFTRQIVYVRPGTFVIFDRVRSKNPSFKKTWVLQAMKPPSGSAPDFIVTNGAGRLFVQTVLPASPLVTLDSGAYLYRYDNQTFSPSSNTGPAPECRVGISPPVSSDVDYFLNVLTATDTSVRAPVFGRVRVSADHVDLGLGIDTITFTLATVGGSVLLNGTREALADSIADASEAERIGLPPGLAVFPNPFHAKTVIALPFPGAEIGVYSITGKKIRALNGSCRLLWDASGLPSGIYIIIARAGTKVYQKRVCLVR